MKGQIMAKDKGKKSDDKGFAKPSAAPATGDAWKFEAEENVGGLFLITPLREQDFESADYGTSKVVVCDIVELNEKKPEKSVEHEEVFAFGGWVKGSLRGYIGEARVVARLEKDPTKTKAKGKNAFAWVLVDGDDDDMQVAADYVASLSPFPKKSGKKPSKAPVVEKAVKKSGKKKAEPEPVKGKKKSKK